MKALTIGEENGKIDVVSFIGGIGVNDDPPYPRIILGEGGHKKATWIPLGKRDAESIIVRIPIEKGDNPRTIPVIQNVSIISLKDENGQPNGKYLVVAPKNGSDDRVLVQWNVSSGYRGSARITGGEGVTIIATDVAWHSGRGNLGETAECLAILKPGQELIASVSGRRVQNPKGKLSYDGKVITVIFGGEELDVATTEKIEGDYI